MDQIEAGGTDQLFLGIAQDSLDGRTGVTDLAVSVADAENVLAIFDDEAETLAGFVESLISPLGTREFPQDTTH